jgi:hypothetical protein
MAAAGLRRDFVPQAQAAQQLLKPASAPPRSYGHRFQLSDGTLPRGLTFHCTLIYTHLYSYRVDYHLLR